MELASTRHESPLTAAQRADAAAQIRAVADAVQSAEISFADAWAASRLLSVLSSEKAEGAAGQQALRHAADALDRLCNQALRQAMDALDELCDARIRARQAEDQNARDAA